MAARLLAEAEAGGSSAWRAWVVCLPSSISTPISFSEEEAQACQVPQTAADILDMQRCLSESHQVGHSRVGPLLGM
jgi:hypothetical protein